MKKTDWLICFRRSSSNQGSRLICSIYDCVTGGETLGGGSVGFGTGAFVGIGEGGGSSVTLGEGTGITGALVFEFWLVLSFALLAPPAFGSWEGDGDGEASGVELGCSAGFVTPPAGIPDSGAPVGGLAASTGWPFGSAANVEVAGVSVVGPELRVKAKITPKTTSNPTADGIKIFQGLKLADGAVMEAGMGFGEGVGTGGFAIGVVTRRRTNVSSSGSSANSWASDAVGTTTRVCCPDVGAVTSIPAAMVKSSTSSPTVL
jgi:hypothetical protein